MTRQPTDDNTLLLLINKLKHSNKHALNVNQQQCNLSKCTSMSLNFCPSPSPTLPRTPVSLARLHQTSTAFP